MQVEILNEIGLSTTEARVYLALLELGSSLAGKITKKSEVNRTNVYDALERLIEKGLVTYVVSANRKVFRAVHPNKLKEILEEKKNKLEDNMKELEAMYESSKEKEEATIYKGKKGIKSVFEDIIKERKEVFVYGAEGRFKEMFPAFYIHWQDKRAKLGIKLNIIFTERVKKRKINLKKCMMKFLPNTYDFPSTILAYGNKVVTIVWSKLPFAFMVTSEEVAKSNMNFFEMLWKSVKD